MSKVVILRKSKITTQVIPRYKKQKVTTQIVLNTRKISPNLEKQWLTIVDEAIFDPLSLILVLPMLHSTGGFLGASKLDDFPSQVPFPLRLGVTFLTGKVDSVKWKTV